MLAFYLTDFSQSKKPNKNGKNDRSDLKINRKSGSRWLKLTTRSYKRRVLLTTFLALSLVFSNRVIFIDEAQALQSDLTASLEPAGEMDAPAEFTNTTVENFNGRTSLISSTNVGTFTTIANNTVVTAQSGGTNSSPTNTDYTVCSTVTDIFDANYYGGAGGTGKGAALGTNGSCTNRVGGVSLALPNVAGVTPTTNIYRYIGFWWSAGNAPNIVRLIKSGSVEATFTTTNLLSQLDSAPSSPVADYFGNPSSGQNSDTSTNNGWSEPYAFIHLRLPTGFDAVQFIGQGFEFDNVTIRQNVPASTSSEVAIVGSGVVGSCANLSDTNAQYVLRNGSFEDNYITNVAGDQNASIADIGETNTESEIAKWVEFNNNNDPHQFAFFRDADSGLANRLPFWLTSASDGLIELQRLDGFAADGSTSQRNTASYPDKWGPRSADGNFHAEINATQRAALYQDIKTIGGEKITWTIKHRGRFYGSSSTNNSSTTDDKDKFEIKIGSTTSTTAQTPSRKRLPEVIWNSANATYTAAWTNFTTNSSGHTAQTMYTRLEDGWVLYTGTYTVPANQTTTRFEFASRGTGSGGNLIDDIGFDPIIACPRTITIQQNVSADYDFTPLTNSQIPNYTYPDTTTVTSVSINGGSGTASLDTSNSTISLSSNTIGSFQVLYTLTDINSQTSTSTITVNVENATGQNPNIITVDPRVNSITLPELPISGSTSAMVCIRQVSNANGDALSGSSTLNVSRSSTTSGVTFNSATNLWNFLGTTSSVQSQTSAIQISGLNSNPLVNSGSKFIEIGYTAATTYGTSACFTGTNRVIELKSLALSREEQFSVTLD